MSEERLFMSNHDKIPIYYDEIEYRIVDAVSELPKSRQLQPSNIAASKLCRCIECLKDILEILEAAQQVKANDKLKRRLKQLFTPLFSFLGCLNDLLHDIQSNPDTKRGLNPDVDTLVSRIEKKLKENVPFEVLRTIRDKTSAHIDKKMAPIAVQQLLSKIKTHEVGWWLHCLLTVFFDLLKLPIYQWCCESSFPGCIGIISADVPALTIFKLDGIKLSRIECIFQLKKDPRMEVFNLVEEVVKQSKWMFREHDLQIINFKEDKPGSTWAKSLESIPKNGIVSVLKL